MAANNGQVIHRQGNYSIHPLCLQWPELNNEDYARLKADIAEHGLISPITLYQGSVVDGRHRLRACGELGIEPIFRELDEGQSPQSFVLRANLLTRTLSSSQKVWYEHKIGRWRDRTNGTLPLFESDREAARKLARRYGLSTATAKKALTARKYVHAYPLLDRLVDRGKVTPSDITDSFREMQDRIERQRALRMVDEGYTSTLAAAIRVITRRKAEKVKRTPNPMPRDYRTGIKNASKIVIRRASGDVETISLLPGDSFVWE